MNQSGMTSASHGSFPLTEGKPLAGNGHDSLLRVCQLSKAYGPRLILKDLEFDIRCRGSALEPAPMVALLGPSGIGKSTLLRMLAGLEPPSQGLVMLGQHPVRPGQVGLVFQDYPLLAHRTVMGNLVIAARQAGLNRGQAEAQALSQLELFGLSHHAATYPVRLSGGQRQRVALAQQFLCQHRILLMDEPFSGLDIVAVSQLCQLLQLLALRPDCHLIVVATHHLEAALRIADVICLLGEDPPQAGFYPGARFQACFRLSRTGQNGGQDPDTALLRQQILQLFTRTKSADSTNI